MDAIPMIVPITICGILASFSTENMTPYIKVETSAGNNDKINTIVRFMVSGMNITIA